MRVNTTWRTPPTIPREVEPRKADAVRRHLEGACDEALERERGELHALPGLRPTPRASTSTSLRPLGCSAMSSSSALQPACRRLAQPRSAPTRRARVYASARRRCRRSRGSTVPCWRTARRRPCGRHPPGRSRARPSWPGSPAGRPTRSSRRRDAPAGCGLPPHAPYRSARVAVGGTEVRFGSQFGSSPLFRKVDQNASLCKFPRLLITRISRRCHPCLRPAQTSDRQRDSDHPLK